MRLLRRPLHPAASTARELSSRGRRPAHDAGKVIERLGNMSSRTKVRRSAGSSVSSTTSNARPTGSASSVSRSGSGAPSRLTIGSGTCSSRRALREGNMSRQDHRRLIVFRVAPSDFG
jgi:hypothetical protein